MAKLIKKDKCKFIDGYIVKKNRQVGIPYAVWASLNKLETILQQYYYLRNKPQYCEGPSLKGFKRKSNLDAKIPYVDMPDTPTIDARVDEAIKFMAEADAMQSTAQINEALEDYHQLIKWLDDSKFFEGNCFCPIDTYMLGNPLELTAEAVVDLIAMVVNSPIVIED